MADAPLGRLCWYELLTTDPDAAPGFYGAIAGWGTQVAEEMDPPYTMWMNGEAPVGGVMALPEPAVQGGAPSHWLVHISTPDVKATAAKAQELGGQVLHEIDVPGVGTFVVIKDPQAAVFAAFQPEGDAPGHDGPAAVGEFSWCEVTGEDWEASWSFYSALFGWEKSDSMEMGEMGTYQMFSRGAHPLGGMYNRPPHMPVNAWLFYIRVPDVNAAVDTVKELGGTVLNGPQEVPGGDLVAMCMDPQGAAFAVHATAAS